MDINPFESPRDVPNAAGAMDPNLYRRMDALYRNGKLLPLITVLAIVVPFLMLLVAPMGLVYAAQRKLLLADIGSTERDAPEALGDSLSRDKLAAIRRWRTRFYVPSILVALVLIPAVTMYLLGVPVRGFTRPTLLPPGVR